MNRAFVVL